MSADLVLTNGRLVAGDRVVSGTLLVEAGLITEIDEAPTGAEAVDLGGDWLLPGLVELHTDNLERQFSPRPGVRWPPDAAMLQHDVQVAAAGITTVCDAVCVGFYGGKRERLDFLQSSLDALHEARRAGALKSEHFLHLRLETTDPGCLGLFEPLMGEPDLVLVSFMDHTPGQRQWRDLAKYRQFHMGLSVRDEDEFQAMIERRIVEQREHAVGNRARLVELLKGHPAVRASHDDTTAGHVTEGLALGVTIAEFPTTLEAATAARQSGMGVVMGAPNLVLGGSHSGNVGAAELARRGLLDALSSDYVPAAMLQAGFGLARQVEGVSLPKAVAMASRGPALLLGLEDRGEIAVGCRADLVRVREIGATPTVVEVYRAGRRIA